MIACTESQLHAKSMTDSKIVTTAAKRKPPAAGMGRPKGAQNKTTGALKEAILLAAAQVGKNGKGENGLIGYLEMLAVDEPTSFATLLGKVLPLQVTGDPDQPLKVEFSWRQ